MKRVATSLVLFSIVFHLAVFVVEAFLWMRPGVHELVLRRLLSSSGANVHEQARVVAPFLVNQGFYNLFLALAGIVGIALQSRGKAAAGEALIAYMCLSAVAAGIVLALSTPAYVGASMQAVPSALALLAWLHQRRSLPRRSLA